MAVVSVILTVDFAASVAVFVPSKVFNDDEDVAVCQGIRYL
jgi:hypothetical protein